MGRSTSSCLKIITCSGDAATAGDEDLSLNPPESKASSDRRKWSFRKKSGPSGRHRVLSNTVISEPVSVGYNKECLEASVDHFESPNILNVPQKDHIEELPLPSPTVNSELADPPVTDRNTTATEHKVGDSDAVIIQAAIRGYCARRELLKLKNVVKLQAFVRGHLVRRQAIGTLHCVQAIVKLQALVRARQTRQYVKDTEGSTSLANGISSTKPHKTRCSTEMLLSNKFAHQLLESMPNTKHIPIKCDTSKSDSAWIWLERWMAITSSDARQQEEQNLNQNHQKNEEDTKPAGYEAPTEVPVAVVCMSSDLKLAPGEAALSNEGEGINKSSTALEFQPLENEGNDRFMFGSRKPCNPAFAAVQSKFEELSSTSSVGRSESKSDSSIPQLDSLAETKDFNSAENSISRDPRTQIAASECGTEISISSTLDSPDRSEAEGEEIVLEIGSLGKGNCAISDGVTGSPDLVNVNAEANNSSIESEVLEPQVKQQLEEPTTSEMLTEMETPRSHVTVPELNGTPSSQVSVNASMTKKDGKMPIRKQRLDLIGKRSPSTPNDDSGGPKDSKAGKRRNSLGVGKPDHVDNEPRISTSSTSVPSYMQATESARAKANASVSPKASPDVHDKDNYPKKRHSLPIAANGKQQGSSPRMQRSASQAQQIPKANGTHSPNNSAERRWQR